MPSSLGRASYQVLGEPEAQAPEHAPQIIIRISDTVEVSNSFCNVHLTYADLMNVSGLSK